MRSRVLLLLVAVLALVLAGCGDGSSPAAKPTASASSPATYVGLGDSYAAAPGVPTTERADRCERSTGNYAHLLAAKLPQDTLDDVSCSGATTTSMRASQLDALSASTRLVTVRIGGNDFDLFATLVSNCVQLGLGHPTGSPCRTYMHAHAADGGGDLLEEKIDGLTSPVTAALRAVHERAPKAKVYLVGYPQLVPAHGTCDLLPLAVGDYGYVRGLEQRLDGILRNAADQTGARYVDMLRVSEGHDVCAGSAAWVNGVVNDPARAIPFHPFAAEQQAVADQILADLKG